MRRPSRTRGLVGVLGLVLVTGCSTPDADTPSTASTVSASSVPVLSTSGTADESSSPASRTPVTEPGMLMGPGIGDTEITLGTLIDPDADRGFSQGLELWKNSVNTGGGVCGRAVRLTGAGIDGVTDDLPDAYRATGGNVIGFVTETDSATTGTELASMLSADQIPALTTVGTAADLLFDSPVVIGPTTDIIAINAADTLLATGVLGAGRTIGVVSDGSAAAANALDGLRWFAAEHDLTIRVQSSTVDTSVLRTLPAVFSLAAPAVTATLAGALPASTIVVTTLRGFDADLIAADDAGHVEVALSTPAVGSDFPGAVAITTALTAAGEVPGASSFAGYATGVTWQRLLTAACDAQSLTRAGVQAAMTTIGAASLESVLGASDTALPVGEQQPATRSSAMAVADPAALTGMRPLAGPVQADGIGDYAAPLR